MLRPWVFRHRYSISHSELLHLKSWIDSSRNSSSINPLRAFDPNSDSVDSLIAKGVPSEIANNIFNYRVKVKQYAKPEDLKKLYKIDSSHFELLRPYIVIGRFKSEIGREAPRPKAKTKKEVELLRMNSASKEEWRELKGIGKVLSARILAYKELLGGFSQKEQLKEVYGISDSLYSAISQHLILDSTQLSVLNVHTASYRELLRHPYISKAMVDELMKWRSHSSDENNQQQFWSINGFNTEASKRLKPYLIFDQE